MTSSATAAPPPLGARKDRPPTRKLPELEGLRGLLSLWVAGTHLLCWCGVADFAVPAKLRGLWASFIYAQPAVDVFIILSGFAIFHLLNEKPSSYGRFMVGRFFRIVPVYWTCLVMAVITAPLGQTLLTAVSWRDAIYLQWMKPVFHEQAVHFWPHLGWHLPLLHGLVPKSWLPAASDTFLVPAWSISLEWQFYLVAPALCLVWRRWWAVGPLLLLGFSSIWWAQDFLNHQPAFLPLKLPLFLLGAWCYGLERWLRSHHQVGVKYGPLVVISTIALSWIVHWQPWAITGWTLCFSAAIGVWDATFPFGQRGLKALLLNGPVQWLGHRSYSLYLLHWPAIVAGLWLLTRLKPGVGNAEAMAWMSLVGFPALLGAIALLHRLIEVPGMRLGRRLSTPR